MIALCREHADKADNGAFTDEQIRILKREGRRRAPRVQGKFDWMRNKLLTVAAGNFSYECHVAVEVNGKKCIWFDRDEDGYLLLNVNMPTLASRPGARIEQNVWTVSPDVEELICPPNGRLIEVNHQNGDRFRVEFFTLEDSEQLLKRYAGAEQWREYPEYPLTAVEIYETVAGTDLSFTPHGIEFYTAQIFGNYSDGLAGAAISLEVQGVDAESLFPDEGDKSGESHA